MLSAILRGAMCSGFAHCMAKVDAQSPLEESFGGLYCNRRNGALRQLACGYSLAGTPLLQRGLLRRVRFRMRSCVHSYI